MKDSRQHFIRRESAERALLAAGAEEDQVFGLLLLAETYGSVSIPVFETTDDAWGKHYSLYVQNKGDDWNIEITGVPHY